jgi:gluconokinase
MNLVVVVMGVSGSGKTTVGRLLATRLAVPYAEADDFHPAENIAKISSGTPLSDDDRRPWLQAIGAWISTQSGGVVTCSALKRRYRDILRAAGEKVWFLHLAGDRDLIASRIAGRTDHFMPPALLDSQLIDLEPLSSTEPGIVVDIAEAPEDIVETVIQALEGEFRRG